MKNDIHSKARETILILGRIDSSQRILPEIKRDILQW